jgi:DNA-directed RNA polymerase specialized sigma24 family protein
MARDAGIEARLLRWAEWCHSGDGSGYPVKSVLHEDWSPPSPGMTPTLRVAPHNDARQTQRLVGQLSERMQLALLLHYVKRMPAAHAADVMECRPDTVHARIEAAHGALLRLLEAEQREFCNIQ